MGAASLIHCRCVLRGEGLVGFVIALAGQLHSGSGAG
jgi:hypothetical protein